MLKKEDSLKKRYFYKLITNFGGMLMGLITAGITPRALGPVSYGNYSYLTNFFNQVVSFLEMGTSIGFYSKLSKRQKESGLVTFYIYFSTIISILIILFVFIAYKTRVHNLFWPNQNMIFVILAAVFGLLTWFTQILNKITDAYGLTVHAEVIKLIQRALSVMILLFLYFWGMLNLRNYFYFQIFISLLLIIALWLLSKQKHSTINWKLNFAQVVNYIKEFYEYSHPLFVYALIGLIVGIVDRWMLQYFSGSEQQGFYGLSYTIGSFCFLFTSAMQPLLMREFSISHGNNDILKMRILFRKYIPLLYSIAAYFSCFIAIQAKNVIYIFGGNKYASAVLPVAIMAFYPIHQTYGQLSGSVFYATEQTRIYRNIGTFTMVIGLIVSYFLLAPKNMFGLEAGAFGLALKMVIVQFIGVNIQLFFNAKYLNISFSKYFFHQILSLVLLSSISFFSYFLIEFTKLNFFNVLIKFILSGMIYTGIVITFVFFLPEVFGLNRADVGYIFDLVIKRKKGENN